jgi:DNA mismatch repair ATPase MutS
MGTSNNPSQYYNSRLEMLRNELSTVSMHLRVSYLARLLSFIGMIVMILFYVKTRFDTLFLGLSVFFLILFIIAIIWDIKLSKKQKELKIRVNINEDELKYLNHQFSEFEDGKEFVETSSMLSSDFDLFGQESLFQYLNRSVTRTGKKLFAQSLGNQEKQSEKIRDKQEGVNELTSKPDFLEDFRTLGLQSKPETKEVEKLLEWVKSEDSDSRLIKWGAKLWPFIMAAWIVLTIGGMLSPDLLIIPVVLALLAIGQKSKITAMAHSRLNKTAQTLKKHADLIDLIESTSFSAKHLTNIQSNLISSRNDSGKALKDLFNLLEKFDYRLNFIMGILLNILLLFDFQMLRALRKWKEKHHASVPMWFTAIAKMDALTGYAIFAFNNTRQTSFPEIKEGDFTYSANDLKHPLLPAEESVGNDISFSGRPCVLVITGANMAGKSTFLRTLAVNLILGMNGAPVCAKKMTFSPVDIRSSINIRDSLARHESYFYAELQRLKKITEHVIKHPDTLVILDEILRGTNSKDKHNGSVGLLEKFISLNAIVVIATHDLGLVRS